MHFLYSKYWFRASDIVAVVTIFNVFSYDAVGQNNKENKRSKYTYYWKVIVSLTRGRIDKWFEFVKKYFKLPFWWLILLKIFLIVSHCDIHILVYLTHIREDKGNGDNIKIIPFLLIYSSKDWNLGGRLINRPLSYPCLKPTIPNPLPCRPNPLFPPSLILLLILWKPHPPLLYTSISLIFRKPTYPPPLLTNQGLRERLTIRKYYPFTHLIT